MSLTDTTKNIANIVVFEGGEGVGKTTQIRLLQSLLTLSRTNNFRFFREPGGTKEAEQIREIFVNEDLNLEAITELLLMIAARHENIKKNILPSLKAKKCVILDRFMLSTLIYQGMIYDIDIEKINKLHAWFNHNLIPQLTIVLNPRDTQSFKKRLEEQQIDFFSQLDTSAIHRRLTNVNRKNNKIDKKDIEFHEKIYELYAKSHEFYEGRIEYIDANQDISKIHEQIISLLQENNIITNDINPISKQDIEKVLKK